MLIYQPQNLITQWVCEKLGIRNPGLSASIGIIREGELIGGALFNNQFCDKNNRPFSIEISFVTTDRRWAAREHISNILAYPFYQLKVRRLQATVSKKNRGARQFLEHLGFKYEGTGRQAWPAGGDACVYSLLSREFFNSKWNLRRGQINSIAASSSRSEYHSLGADAVQ